MPKGSQWLIMLLVAASKKKLPTYPLTDVVRLAKGEADAIVTGTAERDADNELGIKTRRAILAIVAQLQSTDFYKTMEAEAVPGLWQDVYRPNAIVPKYQAGVQLYCKVQLNQAKLVVISFKLK